MVENKSIHTVYNDAKPQRIVKLYKISYLEWSHI